MDSVTSDADIDSNKSFENFENPNFRKLYATLSVTTMMGSNCSEGKDNLEEDEEEKKDSSELPDGWEKHEDDNGPYYWHIPSGTIQRDKPETAPTKRDSIIYYEEESESPTNEASPAADEDHSQPRTFLVHSLGWMEFDEKQLTPALSSKAIQRCILELTTRGDNAVRCWGKQDTKQLILKIENSNLKLFDTATCKLLNIQPISGVRVWGVNDNNDFAYVARDPLSCISTSMRDVSDCTPGPPTVPPMTPPVLKCHVFHCETENDQETAHKIATILRDEVIRLKSQQELEKCGKNNVLQRPQNLYIDEYTSSPLSSPAIEFPTPIEEPRKTIIAKYLGRTKVNKPVGVNVLNEAIVRVIQTIDFPPPVPQASETIYNVVALVHISPSTITIESSSSGEILVESRVRYLSFLGIRRDSVKNCGFIIQTDESSFEAHCFECEPSSGALCKTIEAACKLRYQKCLDAHKQRCNSALLGTGGDCRTQDAALNQSSNLKTAIKSVFSKFLK